MDDLTEQEIAEMAEDLVAVGAELDSLDGGEDDDTAVLRDDIAALDPHTPFRRRRVGVFVGSPGLRATCPACGHDGSRLDEWGGFTCQNCSFTNLDIPIGAEFDDPPWLERQITELIAELPTDDGTDWGEVAGDELRQVA